MTNPEHIIQIVTQVVGSWIPPKLKNDERCFGKPMFMTHGRQVHHHVSKCLLTCVCMSYSASLSGALPLSQRLMSIARCLFRMIRRLTKLASLAILLVCNQLTFSLVDAWKHRFTSECISAVHDQVFGAKAPTYATILQLDRKLRAYQVPPALQIAGFGGTSSEPNIGAPYAETAPLILQRHIVLAIREMSMCLLRYHVLRVLTALVDLLYMHRGFFARALSDHAKDPLGSPYGSSVIAAYRSAGSLIALMGNLHSQLQEPMERMWFLWTHMFSCAVGTCQGSV
jgi:hypothetical protein